MGGVPLSLLLIWRDEESPGRWGWTMGMGRRWRRRSGDTAVRNNLAFLGKCSRPLTQFVCAPLVSLCQTSALLHPFYIFVFKPWIEVEQPCRINYQKREHWSLETSIFSRVFTATRCGTGFWFPAKTEALLCLLYVWKGTEITWSDPGEQTPG